MYCTSFAVYASKAYRDTLAKADELYGKWR